MLQKKRLWFSNAELFADKWELMPDTSQLNALINKRPSSISAEEVIEKTTEIVRKARKNAYINCWTASKDESHALWRIYCPTPEGIAIQTTLSRLQKSVHFPIKEVRYEPYETDGTSLDISKLVTQKRPMFAYEQEVRIILFKDYSDVTRPELKTLGVSANWDPEEHLENIWIHPEASFWFAETVTETVRRLAPKLGNSVFWSKMNSSPPIQ
jgi:hypothetical protein